MSTTDSVTTSDISNWLEPILTKIGLTDYTIQIVGNTEKGDGYLGDITFVDVDGIENNEPKKYSFVVKSGKKSKGIRKVMPIREAFKNEIYVYDKILPIFEQFQAEKQIKDPFNNTVKFYGSMVLEDMEALVLENMRERNYTLWERSQPMNKEHVRKVMKTYGKFHALSFALRDQKPKIFKEFSENLVNILKLINEMNDFHPEELSQWENTIKIAQKLNKPNIVNKIRTSLNKVAVEDPNNPYFVILHGDCWNNNFMFNYKDDKHEELVNMCYLDLQLSRIASPVADLSYFLFTCTDPDDLVENFNEILNCYYNSFSDFLTQLGSSPEKMFPYEVFMDHWQTYGNIGLHMLPSIMRICLAQKDEVTDLTDMTDGDLKSVFSYTFQNTAEFERRVIPVLELAIDRGFL